MDQASAQRRIGRGGIGQTLPVSAQDRVFLCLNDRQFRRLRKGREVESGLGEEAAEQAGPVLHPPEPGLRQRGQLAGVLPDQVGQ
jgi:hypothetical protein